MNFFEFPGIKLSALAAAVPNNEQEIMDYTQDFAEGEIEKFCATTGIRKRFNSTGVGTTSSDLCVAAAEEIFSRFELDRSSIDGLIFLTQTPDYYTGPPTSCLIQHRLGLDSCGLVYDSNIGCTAFPFGVQMACANIMAGCKRILLLAGDSETTRPACSSKDNLLFGDCGIAALLERTDQDISPIKIGLHTIGKGYKALITPYGGERHPIHELYRERGESGLEFMAMCRGAVMEGSDVFAFSITEAPKAAKSFLKHFSCTIDAYDIISIHQANKMIVDNVVKRLKAPADKVPISLDRYGNTRGASTALNLCDYAQKENMRGIKNILTLAFGVGLNVALASFEMDMEACLPVIRTNEVFNDGINNYTYF